MEDQLLLQQIHKGSEKAFIALLDKYENRVFLYFVRCFADKNLAQDFTQQVFTNILQQISGYTTWRCFASYLFRMCKNMVFKELRRKKQVIPIDDVDVACYQSVSEDLEKRELAYLIKKGIRTLNFYQQQSLLLKFQENFSMQQIAEILDIPENTVKSHIHRGKKNLRQYMEEQQYEDL